MWSGGYIQTQNVTAPQNTIEDIDNALIIGMDKCSPKVPAIWAQNAGSTKSAFTLVSNVKMGSTFGAG